MTCSLNQIDQTSRKAARGAGLSWGLSDDVGKAIRWLHTYELNGVSMLVALLDRYNHIRYEDLATESVTGTWKAPQGVLSPLLAGASLSDCFDLPDADPVTTAVIAYPLLAAGFIGNIAQIEGQVFKLTWPGVSLYCQRGGLRLDGTRQAVEIATAEFLCCQRSGSETTSRSPHIGEVSIESGIWRRLEQHAHRTYVEASDASRMAGAGAGLNDND